MRIVNFCAGLITVKPSGSRLAVRGHFGVCSAGANSQGRSWDWDTGHRLQDWLY